MAETTLSPRYEIRVLSGTDHAKWACALVTHSSIYSSPVFSPLSRPEEKSQLCHEMFQAALYQMTHQVNSGLSLGIFDTQYQYNYPESISTQGKLYWDPSNQEEATETSLLKEMDFPLLSVALSYDSYYPLDPPKLTSLYNLFSFLPLRNKATDKRDPRPKKEWKATGPKQVLSRGGTVTKQGEEGKGFMKELAWELMRKAKKEGFRGIQIGCMHDYVTRVWERPPKPFEGKVVVRYRIGEEEELKGVVGKEVWGVEITRVWVDLKGGE
ncbi:hypothetical protein QBC38DRAFT_509427 [Podospora fimiseda]|uniref:Uncharacterized protein n=1 Tax=Podospora fimiseda TaxID=252190 RepID=A0AAN7BQW0_9PEZI|nr:hypothetical protein QBC38DRAFT_509427 [Podospora fimiseda]